MSVMSFITSPIVRRSMADDWHALRPEAVLQRLESSPIGLTTRESAARLARVGPNELVQTTRISPLRILLGQFTDVLVIVLIIAAIISAALGLAQNETSDLYDAILIIAIVIMNAVLGFLQEYRAERSLEALKTLAAPRAHVVREGAVVETAMATELGKIAGLVQQETKEETPLQKQLDRLGRQIGIAVLLAAGLIFVIGVLRELPGLDASHVELLFLTAVGLSVAAIPEGLPAIVTISLALGLQRMIRRHALIRKLPAVEALGAASVICSDKTGTLTKGEMNVRAIVASDREYEVRGEGFDPTGDVRIGGQKADLAAHPDLRQLLECAVLCNDAALKNESGRWVVEGDPTEGALLVAAIRAGLDPDSIRADMPRVAEVAFTSERKKMSTLHAELSEPDLRAILSVPEGERHTRLEGAGAYLFVKGAPERVLATCAYHVVEGVRKPLTEYDRKQYLFRNQEMATRALRVLGFAVREFPREVPPLREDALETDLTFLGLAGMMDAPRADAIAAIERCKRAGIHVVMITGDHKLTAMAVAREMGILGEGERGHGPDGRQLRLDRVRDRGRPRHLRKHSEVRRVPPVRERRRSPGHVHRDARPGGSAVPAVLLPSSTPLDQPRDGWPPGARARGRPVPDRPDGPIAAQSERRGAVPGHPVPHRRRRGDSDRGHIGDLLLGTRGPGRRHPCSDRRLHDTCVLRALPRLRDPVPAADAVVRRAIVEPEAHRGRPRLDGAPTPRGLHAVPAGSVPDRASHGRRLGPDAPHLLQRVCLRRSPEGRSARLGRSSPR